ncbi:flagellar biosynthetic protein FliR [Burkholderia contaminans]|uniref:flagellar biosynthetic protein FliR n=1 Tax=Burkholderia contaminans TaxID=488447 RepID=UPI0014549F51|nr:flagellar biosynthetic protein FliR [Burkholderia contaminans]VWC74799.1 flagellar biosynthesis protein FliR [Burkholderia contaminans]
MELLLPELMRIAAAIIWPFCRIAAALAAAPILGDAMIPMRARALAALVLAFTVQPGIPAGPSIDPLSLAAVAVIGEQVAIGGLLGFAFHLVLSALLAFGSIVSSQIGLSMAQMNDPMNGQPSDVLSNVMYVLFILLFFAVDGHLLMTQVLARSFDVLPIGGSAFDSSALRRFALAVGWMFSAAAALALPVTFATLVVQVGLGLLNRAAPTLNLFSLGFSVTTMFGLLLVVLLLPSLPDHYHRMVIHVLDVYDGLAGTGAEAAR